jgi:hypothetical protein
VQLALFALVMLVAAWRMLRGGVMQRADHEPRRLAVVAGGIGVGALSGLVGVGGGFLIVPALVLLAGVPMASAVGTSLAVIALNSFTGFLKYLGVLQHRLSTGRAACLPQWASWATSQVKLGRTAPSHLAPAVRRVARRESSSRGRGAAAAALGREITWAPLRGQTPAVSAVTSAG